MTNQVDITRVKEEAEALFRAGQYYCSEAVIASIRNQFELDMPEEMIAMASGFPIGIGRSKCACGAVTGGIMALGYFFGRTKGSSPTDPQSIKALAVANELQAYFKANHGVICCSVLTDGLDMASGEHKAQCIAFTGEIAEKTAEIILREWPYTRMMQEV